MIRRALGNTPFMLSAGLAVGFLYPGMGDPLEILLVPCLIVALSLSLRGLAFSRVRPGDLRRGLLGYGLNALMGLFVFAASSIIITNPDYHTGFIVMAFMPPAIAVFPFTYLLGGDRRMSLSGLVVSYFFALFVTPVGIWYFTGGVVQASEIFRVLVTLILIPIALSRILRRFGGETTIDKPLVNICFCIVTYVIISLNHAELAGGGVFLLPVALILSARTFGTSFLAGRIFQGKVGEASRVSFMLFASLKNAGLTSVTAYYLFGPSASLPAALSSVFEVGVLIWLSRRFSG